MVIPAFTPRVTAITSSEDLARQTQLFVERKLATGREIPVKRAMDAVLKHLKERLVSKIRTGFPKSDTFIHAPYYETSGKPGLKPGSNFMGEVGMDASGISDPVTGRPLSDYMMAIQQPAQGQLRGISSRKSGGGGLKRTRPPSVDIVWQEGGRWRFSKIFNYRIMPWARQVFPGNAQQVRKFALNVAIKITEYGAIRVPVWTEIFKVGTVDQSDIINSLHPDEGRKVLSILRRHGLDVQTGRYSPLAPRGRLSANPSKAPAPRRQASVDLGTRRRRV